MGKRLEKRAKNLETLVRVLLALVIALVIGLWAAVSTTHEVVKKYETNINTVETVNH